MKFHVLSKKLHGFFILSYRPMQNILIYIYIYIIFIVKKTTTKVHELYYQNSDEAVVKTFHFE